MEQFRKKNPTTDKPGANLIFVGAKIKLVAASHNHNFIWFHKVNPPEFYLDDSYRD